MAPLSARITEMALQACDATALRRRIRSSWRIATLPIYPSKDIV
jgi:hypothetical protein